MTQRTIFRESAVEAYRRRTERDVVPRVVSRPTIICCWVLLGTLVAATVLAWSVRIPTYVRASGMILDSSPGGGTLAAVLFLPPDGSGRLRVGRPVHARIGASGPYLEGAVTNVEPGLIGPTAAGRRYRSTGAPGLITEPSLVVTARLRSSVRPDAYGGSRIDARVQTGSQRLLALLPGFGTVWPGGV